MSLRADVKADFPLLERSVGGHPIVYLDSAASSQKPAVVLDAMDRYYRTIHANVHRGAYEIAALATEAMEDARAAVARFVNAPDAREIVFTKNATEAVNLVARSWGDANLGPGDAVVVTEMEHHANIVPWQIGAGPMGAKGTVAPPPGNGAASTPPPGSPGSPRYEIRWIPVTADGRLDLADLDRLLDGAKLVAVTAMSNVLGTLNPIDRIAAAAHAAGALLLVDACQFVPHLPTDVVAWDADFVAFTGHKMCGPTGIGVLWGRAELLEAMPPFLGGGEMILDVRKDGFTANEVPHKFEAGTPPIAEIVGLGAAVEYLSGLGMDAVRAHEVSLTGYALRTLTTDHGDRIDIHGPAEPAERGGVLSFTYADIHPHDLSQVLDQRGVCIRAGHHCAKPLMSVLGTPATARASLYVYNDESDVDALSQGLSDAGRLFGV
ncbi:MAG TPA: cysteine desulfurase [Acidimicrobiaceae bacterium]|nr:cysteine desulfurase [Acidimicrobiaceae bacterium]HCB36929.1 cysteine desulfurase [Acidimicrobiaceae bacterium]